MYYTIIDLSLGEMLLKNKLHTDQHEKLQAYQNKSQQLLYYMIKICYIFPVILDHWSHWLCKITWHSDV